MASEGGSHAVKKIPQHNAARGSWCRFSGCDSLSGICRMCEPDPSLSAREIAALAALASNDEPATGGSLAARMRRAGRSASPAAAHQAGAALARKGLAVKAVPVRGDYVRYEATNQGREWVARYRAAGGRA
jgi:hypothetical protein